MSMPCAFPSLEPRQNSVRTTTKVMRLSDTHHMTSEIAFSTRLSFCWDSEPWNIATIQSCGKTTGRCSPQSSRWDFNRQAVSATRTTWKCTFRSLQLQASELPNQCQVKQRKVTPIEHCLHCRFRSQRDGVLVSTARFWSGFVKQQRSERVSSYLHICISTVQLEF